MASSERKTSARKVKTLKQTTTRKKGLGIKDLGTQGRLAEKVKGGEVTPLMPRGGHGM
jgi:hypothetical protein